MAVQGGDAEMKKDLGHFLDQLRVQPAEAVIEVDRPVVRDGQLADVVKSAEDAGNPVMLFTDVVGSELPVVSGLYASRERIAVALGVPPERATETYLRALANPVPTNTVTEAPVHEVVRTGEAVDLDELPIITHAPLDAGRYITAGVGIVRDPESGAVNAGIYRLQVVGRNLLTVGADPDHDLGMIISRAAQTGRRVPFAVVIGHHPAFTLASQADVPLTTDSLEVAGALLGEPLDVTGARTIDMPVPADAEIVLEGEIDPRDQRHDGPFGEFTYYYGSGEAPVFTVTALTRRAQAVYVDLHNAHVEHRCLFIHPGSEARLHQRVAEVAPSLVRVHMPFSGAGLAGIVVLREPGPGEARAALSAALEHDRLMLKHVIAVDEDVDPADLDQVVWALSTRFQGDRDLVVIDGAEGLSLDPSSRRADGSHRTTKLGFDATAAPEVRLMPRADLLHEH
jgi:2,5-furandicarboxylate decarboxylase 1